MRPVAVFGGDGVGATKHLFGEIAVIVAEAIGIGAVLAEDFDVAHEVGCDNDITV